MQEMLGQKSSIRNIARALSRSPSSVSREIKRNRPPERNWYTPRVAHERALRYRKHRGGRTLDRHDTPRLCHLSDETRLVSGTDRSHREDKERLYDQYSFGSEDDLRYRVRLWNMYYNDLEHGGLKDKTPNEFLTNYQLTNPPNVPA